MKDLQQLTIYKRKLRTHFNSIHQATRFATAFAIFAIALSVTSFTWAQTANTGAVTGTVTDSSGAVVPNVKVEIVSEATSARRTVSTEPDGVYRFPLLPPGTYRIQASAGTSGFKMAVRAGVPVAVTEITNLNIKLEVGSPTETVTVQAEQMAQTESNALGHVTDERTVKNLPLVTRNFTQIIGLSAGANVGLTDATQLGTGSGGMASYTNEDLSVNGARNYDNNFQMDGITANDLAADGRYSGGIAIPNPDAIAEFKVLTGQYDASYGRNAGASVNVMTKSGSNQFHGNLFEFFRNEDMNANNFFFNADGVPRGILRQNQFGGTFGGPIVRDKLLFFTSYQGTRQLNGVASGCSSSFVGPPLTNDRSATALGALFGGQSGALGGVAVTPDGSNINPVALQLLNLKIPNGGYAFPTPQALVDGEGHYAASIPCPFQENQYLTNLDYLQSSKSKLSAKFFLSQQGDTETLPNGVAGSPLVYTAHFRNLSVTHDYIFSSVLLNQLEFGFHRTVAVENNVSSFTFPEIGSTVIPQSENIGGISMGPEYIGAGYFGNSSIASSAYTLQDTLTYIRGRHTLRFGGGATRTDVNFNYLFPSFITILSMPDLLLGESAAQNGSSFSNIYGSDDIPGQPSRDYVIWNPWAYVQDDYKVNSRLTLNVGLRYERLGEFAEQNGRNGSFSLALADPNPPASGSQAGYVLPSNFRGTIPMGSIRVDNQLAIYGNGQNTFSPRIGFAWQMLPGSSRFVLRGGYGIYFSTLVGFQTFEAQAYSSPWTLFRGLSGAPNASATFAAPFSALGPLLSPSDFPLFPSYSPSSQNNFFFPALNSRPPITQEFSLNLQTQLGGNYLLEVGYVGSRATHLTTTVSLNQAGWATPTDPIRGQTTNTLANLQSRVPFQGFVPEGLNSFQTTGYSWYNALQATLTKRFSHGLQFLASYTYARQFDDEGGDTNQTDSSVVPAPGNQFDARARYGPVSTIRPHRLVVNFVYDLPHVDAQRFVNNVLDNWSLSGVTTLQSGHPLSIYSTNATNAYGINNFGGDFGELAPGCTRSQLQTRGAVVKKLNSYFNQGCIGSYPVIGSDGIATDFGNMSPGLLNGPAEANLDLALTKRIPVDWFGRESNWEFRAEAFNLFNTPIFGDPDQDVSDGAAFGVISKTIANPRLLQLALKFNF